MNYVRDAFIDRLYKFCPHQMNLMVTSGSWSSYAYGLEYYSGNPYDCVAYCVP